MRGIIAALALWAQAAGACETALVLTIDVSNSVDAGEYRLQIDGLADALRDPEVIETMVDGQIALAVVQWSGEGRQELSIPWTRIRSAADVENVSITARTLPRAFVLSDTAIAEAILFSLALFDEVPDCARRVIDISGDGTANAGGDPRRARAMAERQGVTINGIAIEGFGLVISTYFQAQVITRDGFVVTARTHRDYPRAIREKILRELARVLG